MIQSFNEHSANERTFLAWVRTGIAVIAFGFVVEKFNLFILALTASASLDAIKAMHADHLTGPIGRNEGAVLMLTGVALLLLGFWRFVRTERLIDDPQVHARASIQVEIAITLILAVLVSAYCASILLG